MIRPETCFTAACDVCAEPMTDYETEATLHFPSAQSAAATARAWGWLATSTTLICPTEDRAHQAAFDALLPTEPMPLNQPTLDGETA